MFTIYHNNEYIKKYEKDIIELYSSNKLTDSNNINGNTEYNLGVYYHFIERYYELAKIYYVIAIDNNNSYAMNYLGFYYYYIEKKYELAKKYYLMAIDNNNSDAMVNLGRYYEEIEYNFELVKKYYLMAIKNGHSYAKRYFKYITSRLERYILYKQNNINFDEELTADICIYIEKIEK